MLSRIFFLESAAHCAPYILKCFLCVHTVTRTESSTLSAFENAMAHLDVWLQYLISIKIGDVRESMLWHDLIVTSALTSAERCDHMFHMGFYFLWVCLKSQIMNFVWFAGCWKSLKCYIHIPTIQSVELFPLLLE